MRKVFQQTLSMLNQLDPDRACLVSYDDISLTVTLRQVGNIFVTLSQLKGYLTPIKHTCILYPEDLRSIKDTLKYLIDNDVTFMCAPIKGGYKIWEIGDVAYTSRPRLISKLKFYSISNRFLCWITRSHDEEIKMLYRLQRR